ncbi:pyrroloquinoline quinone biosynthesis protein PqqE [Granulicella mallensis]|uniref:PqqA peptide cyclase n=1 Tax=Granulicella mallensis (strain ATCC BAA-1857 / DSM 23137 / MP5ACTX8) TaxID=682795 RepID=G8P0B1_GRAMM|nr:pyrroloquinoline quinone biosynthesis protein PqqE [Granulicella mallensis]AEU36905.1 coenzyme PQQ biosynthesis protein E [Granulicella mallensis MP5ACTX8]
MLTSGPISSLPKPLSLIAEVTHRCPLHCLYCSNPLELKRAEEELSTADWKRVFEQAASLGILHLHLTGGEPLARKDLAELIDTAHRAGLYVNMITSGVGLTRERLGELVEAGLEHLQLSFQDLDETTANHIAGTRAHALKLALVPVLKEFPLAFTVNLVVHRMNLDRLESFIGLAEELGPDRLEIAHVQYYGWALKNRSLLMPTQEQVDRSLPVIEAAKERLRGKIHLDSVFPDYFGSFPKACVGGWGRQMMLIDPTGQALPCHSAAIIPGLRFDKVQDHDLAWIWESSAAFQRFRGDSWMPETCLACPRKEKDFGGCRCQAFLLTGDAQAIDPVCRYSPDHHLLTELRLPSNDVLPIWRG